LGVAAVAAMLATIPLGFLSPRTGPVPHAALAFGAAMASIIVHVQRGAGADLGASLVLGLGVALGIGVPDGVVDPEVHMMVAIAGVALSCWVQLRSFRRPPPRPMPKP
jgi:hypothetical protein